MNFTTFIMLIFTAILAIDLVSKGLIFMASRLVSLTFEAKVSWNRKEWWVEFVWEHLIITESDLNGS